MDHKETRPAQVAAHQPIKPLKAPLPVELLFERREVYSSAGEPIIRKMEYRLDAARAVPDFSPFIDCWDRCHSSGFLPTYRDFAQLHATNDLAAVHLVDSSCDDPGLFRFLRFDSQARTDRSDLSGKPLSEYPDPMIRNSINQDYAAAAFDNRGTIMDVSVKADGNARRFARLMLPVAANEGETRPSQLISIVRLLELKRRPLRPDGIGEMDIADSYSRGGGSLSVHPIAPTRSSTRQVLMTYFHNGNQELLADQDLLEMLLRQTDDSEECRTLAGSLIEEFGSLAALLAVGTERLIHIPGMTPQALIRLKVVREMASRVIRLEMVDKPVFSGTGVVLDYCRARMAHETIEHVRIIYLDQKNRLIVDEPIHGGGVASVPVNPRNIIKRALVLDAQSIVIAHNHPSGDPSPSGADVEVTRDLKKAAEAVGIRLLDHLIIGRSGHVSLRTLGYLEDG